MSSTHVREERLTLTALGRVLSAACLATFMLVALPGVVQAVDADRDGDGLIEIDNLTMLHNVRYNLAGTSYKTSTTSVGNSAGCPATNCNGYELSQDLDFDFDGDGSTWSVNNAGAYSLDAGDSKDPYFVVTGGAGGWKPILGPGNNAPFTAVFEGNGRSISNLAIRSGESDLGVFGIIDSGVAIRNLGLIDNLTDYTGNSNNPKATGGLVGWQRGGSITASYATGDVDGGTGNNDRVGVLVGSQSGGSIVASYGTGNAYGRNGSNDRVGGLVGWQEGGSISASYATGNVDGGDGNDEVGALVGRQEDVDGLITASYATGNAAGGGGTGDSVGALVGRQQNGSIAASYATGNADGGGGNDDSAGALVGLQQNGSITASYATGYAAGGAGTGDSAGAIVGRKMGGTIVASYGFGPTMAELAGDAGTTWPMGVTVPEDLTSGNAGGSWNAAANNTHDAWDFGTTGQLPALKYADYDDGGSTFDCNQFPASVTTCGTTLLPRQAGLIAGGASFSTVGNGLQTMLSVAAVSRVTISSWSWQQLEGVNISLSGAASAEVTFTAPDDAVLLFEVTGTDADGNEYVAQISLFSAPVVDSDNNGLIDIDSLLKLHNMRHNLAGTSYKTSATSAGNTLGCPLGVCTGYELTQDLDLDGDGNGTSWTYNGSSYLLDGNDSRSPYFEVDANFAGGWLPIGNDTNPFTAIFEGNDYSIHNLGIRRGALHLGLFGAIGGNATIRNVGLVDNLTVYNGSEATKFIYIGGLVGLQQASSIVASHATGPAVYAGSGVAPPLVLVGGLVGEQNVTGASISASYATGSVEGGATADATGGLVGKQLRGLITASYATGNVDGGGGDEDRVGALVGQQTDGSIVASYATGNVDGGGGNDDRVGALVGWQENSDGLIMASYATGSADGGDGTGDNVGALVGRQQNGSIVASYATGNADGGGGTGDNVGALVGWQENGSISASYATGNADGGGGNDDDAGALVGLMAGGSITASYATGYAAGGDGTGDYAGALVGRTTGGSVADSYGFGPAMAEIVESTGTTLPGGVGGPTDLASGNAGSSWTAAASNAAGAWDFGTSSQIPALNYADYDGSGTTFNCNQFPAGFTCGTLLPRQAGLIAGGASFTTVGNGLETMLSVTAAGRIPSGSISWSWTQLGAANNVALTGNDTSEVTFLAPDNEILLFEVTATDGDGNDYVAQISLFSDVLVDGDSDGLIDIDDLTMLHNMRYNLAGTSYMTGATSPMSTLGCPQGVCTGYELTGDLDFDTDGDGTWSVDNAGNYTLDMADNQAPYFEVTGDAGGWLPIGDATNPFTAVFEGNGRSIHNLGIRRGARHIGLFGVIGGNAIIRNVGLVDNLAEYTGSDANFIFVGGLVGIQNASSILASHATGPAVYSGSGAPELVLVGGLVGEQHHADARVTASYATGDVKGGARADATGGLVGKQFIGAITASYATGNVDGRGGNGDFVGALLGQQTDGSVAASYATGNADGGDGNNDAAGALVGQQSGGSITASYATGHANGGAGTGDSAGTLVGQTTGGSIVVSYGFGPTTGEVDGDAGSTSPVAEPMALTSGNAGNAWDAVANNTSGAWDYGTGSQIPALRYADYDGSGATFDCDQFPAGVTCGTTLLPRQAGLIAGGASFSTVANDTQAMLSVTVAGRVTIGASSWSWRQLEGDCRRPDRRRDFGSDLHGACRRFSGLRGNRHGR